MDWKILLLPLLSVIFYCCAGSVNDGNSNVDELNRRAYSLRYSDIDSSMHLSRQALNLSLGYEDGKCYALNNIAYVAYQQMRYDRSLHLLSHIYRQSHNQLELLCADVMSMKVAQRIGDGKLFFDRRLQALHRIKRIHEAMAILSESQKLRLLYAETELHIVSSTYYYYLGQDSSAVAEMQAITEELKIERDTTQWLYYQYMIGSGGLVQGTNDYVRLTEFDHLFRAYSVAKSNSIIYFEANSLQSLASFINDSMNAELIRIMRPDAFRYLLSQSQLWDTDVHLDSLHSVSYALASKATSLFTSYKDLFQTACAHRTMGEVLFSAGNYELAFQQFQHALSLVESQRNRSSQSVVSWMASIHEKLSLAYSALNVKPAADYHRNIYLDILDSSRQNKELDSRMDELSFEVKSTHTQLFVLLLLILVVVCLAIFYSKRISSHTQSYFQDVLNIRNSLSHSKVTYAVTDYTTACSDDLEMLQDECRMIGMKIEDNVRGNIERRAKVSLVYAIVPYLDRMLAEARRMQSDGKTSPERLAYISELTDEIMHINESLTNWIQMQQGQLKLHITTFPLQRVLDIIALSSHTFQQKGVTLSVANTDCEVKADQPLTLFMINTLADNARKFTPEGGKVSVDVTPAEDYVEVSICDTGVGLSAEDVDTLNNSKVYDSSHLGLTSDGKGFGFGIMNCKGIINKYRKQSSIFSVCDFGVESKVGEGSRFWFRLPRILTILLLVLFPSAIFAAKPSCYQLYDSLYTANVQGRYADAIEWGDSVFQSLTSASDTALLVSLHNEMAIASLALHRWDDYQHYNSECVRLHRLYSQDASLATYCQQMEKMHSDSIILFVLLVLFSLAAIILFYLTFLRDRLRSKSQVMTLRQELDNVLQQLLQHVVAAHTTRCKSTYNSMSLRSSLDVIISSSREKCHNIVSGNPRLVDFVRKYFGEMDSRLSQIDMLEQQIESVTEQKDKLRFEEERLYVRNQIIDNSLSTIKHETMYYPARTQQIVRLLQSIDANSDDIAELSDLITYYHDVYMLLYEQTERQLEHNSMRCASVSVHGLYDDVDRIVSAYCSRHDVSISLTHDSVECNVCVDRMMLDMLISSLLKANLPYCNALDVSVHEESSIVSLCFRFVGRVLDDEQLHQLFSPTTADVSYLIVKQIIREHDAYFNHPGLRLLTKQEEGGFSILFSLVKNK